MKKLPMGLLLVQGIGLGLLTALANGLSLPILLASSIRVITLVKTGTWPSGPVLVTELWILEFLFGATCSLLPGMIAACVLRGGILSMWIGRMREKWFRLAIGLAIGILVAVCYVALLFCVEPIINFQEYGLLAALLLVEQVIIFVWIAARLSIQP